MNIIVCIKQVVDSSVPLEIDTQANDISYRNVTWVLNPADMSAIRMGVALREGLRQAQVIALTLGPDRADTALRRSLAFGVDRAVRLDIPQANNIDANGVAYLLAEAVRRLEASVVLCGSYATDTMGGQTPIALAAALQWPVITSVVEAAPLERSRKSLIIQRRLDGGWRQVVEIDPPVVVKCDPDYLVDEYPSLARHVRSLKAPVAVMSSQDLGIGAEILANLPSLNLKSISPPKPRPKRIFTPDSSLSPVERMKQIISGGGVHRTSDTIQGPANDVAAALIRQLRQRKVI